MDAWVYWARQEVVNNQCTYIGELQCIMINWKMLKSLYGEKTLKKW